VDSVAEEIVDDGVAVPGLSGDADGPFDIEDFDDPAQATLARLDLGSVLIPMQPDGQVQVELNQMGVPSAIWIITGNWESPQSTTEQALDLGIGRANGCSRCNDLWSTVPTCARPNDRLDGDLVQSCERTQWATK
jgi:hypothetical protein